tara:strand:+ start:57 stop:929 length:873 start_codon:yes stop_codon:yes gene_type:complete
MIIKNLKIKNLKYLKGQELPFGLVTSGLVLNLDGFYSSSLADGSNTWYDLTSNNYDGTMLNGATYNTDKGGGLTFDGIDDTLDLGDILNGVIAGTSPTYTVQTWIKFDTLVDDTGYVFFGKLGLYTNPFPDNQRQLLIVVRNITTYNYGGIRLEHIPYRIPDKIGNFPQVRLVRSDGDIIEPNKLHNLTVCFDGSINTNDGLDRPTFYIDGKLQSNVLVLGAAEGYGILTNSFQATTNKLALNGYLGATGTIPTNPFAGTTYQTLVYDRVLTQEEVTQNINTLNGRYDVT